MCAPTPPALSLVFITPLDYQNAFNNREHNAVRYYCERGDQVTLVGKKLNRESGIMPALTNGLTSRTTLDQHGGATIKMIDPFLNFFGGISRQTQAKSAGTAPSVGQRIKSALVRILKPLSLLREVAATAAFVRAAWTPVRHADAVIAFGPWAALPAYLLKRCGRVRHLVYVDRDFEAGLFTDARRAVTGWLEASLPRKADTFITIGPRLQTLRTNETGRVPLICETGVDLAKMAPARAKLRLESDRFELVYVGNVIEWSGVDLLLNALPKAPRHVTFRIIGSGLPAYINALKARTNALGVSDRVTFVGQVPYAQMPAQLAGAAVGFAMSQPNLYRTYAYPLKVLEYFAAGLPVLATQGTEGGDIVARADAGLALPYDADNVVKAVADLATNQDQYTRFQENALDAAAQMTWARSFDRERAAILDDMSRNAGS